MAILIVETESGAEFYDIGDVDPRPIERLIPKLSSKARVCGHVVDGEWFGIEPQELDQLFPLPGDLVTKSDMACLDPYLEAPKDLRERILEGWRKIHSSSTNSSVRKIDIGKVAVLMRQGKADRFTLIDEAWD